MNDPSPSLKEGEEEAAHPDVSAVEETGTGTIETMLENAASHHELTTSKYTMEFIEPEVENEFLIFGLKAFRSYTIMTAIHGVWQLWGFIRHNFIDNKPARWVMWPYLAVGLGTLAISVLTYFLCIRPDAATFEAVLRRARRLEYIAAGYIVVGCVYSFTIYELLETCTTRNRVGDEVGCYGYVWSVTFMWTFLSRVFFVVRLKYAAPLYVLNFVLAFAGRPLGPNDSTRVLVTKIVVVCALTLFLCYNHMLVELRMRRLFEHSARMKRNEKTASEISEKLRSVLLLCMPKSICDRLLKQHPVLDIAPMCSIGACHLCDFHQWCVSFLVGEVAQTVSDLYAAFDILAERSGVDRIRVVGDLYQFAVGLRSTAATANYVDHSILLALRMLISTQKLAKRLESDIAVQIGIDSGYAVGAIVGAHSLVYDAFGRTAQTAIRAAMHASPSTVLVSMEAANQSSIIEEKIVAAQTVELSLFEDSESKQQAVAQFVQFSQILSKPMTMPQLTVWVQNLGETSQSLPIGSVAASEYDELSDVVRARSVASQDEFGPNPRANFFRRRLGVASDEDFGDRHLLAVERKLRDITCSCEAPEGAFADPKYRASLKQFREGADTKTAMGSVGVVMCVLFIALFMDGSSTKDHGVAGLTLFALTAVLCLCDGVLRWFVPGTRDVLLYVAPGLFLLFFISFALLDESVVTSDISYVLFVFAPLPIRAFAQMNFGLSSLLIIVCFMVPAVFINSVVMHRAIFDLLNFVFAWTIVLLANYFDKKKDVASFTDATLAEALAKASTDDMRVVEAVLEMVIPKAVVPSLAKFREQINDFIHYYDDIAVLHLYVEEMDETTMDMTNAFDAISAIESARNRVEEIVAKFGDLSIIATGAAGEVLIAGPLEIEESKEDKVEKINAVVQASCNVLSVLSELRKEFGASVTGIGCVSSAMGLFFGTHSVSFALTGPAIRQASALLAAAPPSFFGVNGAFKRLLENGKVPFVHIADLSQHSQWRVRGVGSVTVHPVSLK